MPLLKFIYDYQFLETINQLLVQTENAFSGEEHQAFHWDGNNQKAVLLVHGFPGTPAEMRPIAQIFYDLGWTVHGVLLPGFGADIDHILERTHQDWLNAVSKALAILKHDHEQVILVGFSMGGAIALKLATEKALDGLVLFSPFLEIDHLLWRALPAIRLFLPKVKIFKLFKPDFSNPQTRDGIHNFMPNADLDDPDVQQEILEFELPISMFNEIRTIGKQAAQVAAMLQIPVQVFQGLQDDLVKPERTRKLVADLSTLVDYTEVNAPHEIINPALDDWSIIVSKLRIFAETIAVKGEIYE